MARVGGYVGSSHQTTAQQFGGVGDSDEVAHDSNVSLGNHVIRAGEIIREVGGIRPLGPSRKRVPKYFKGPKTTYTTIAIAENSQKEVKRAHFVIYWVPPGPSQEMELMGPGGEGPSRSPPPPPPRFLQPCTSSTLGQPSPRSAGVTCSRLPSPVTMRTTKVDRLLHALLLCCDTVSPHCYTVTDVREDDTFYQHLSDAFWQLMSDPRQGSRARSNTAEQPTRCDSSRTEMTADYQSIQDRSIQNTQHPKPQHPKFITSKKHPKSPG